MLTLGAISFAVPWALSALLALPVIWWLLRLTPPLPTTIRFPAVRLLFGLGTPEESAAKTPLWLLVVRLVLAALVILAAAHPLLNAGTQLTGKGPIIVVIDDGWAAAAHWPLRRAMLAGIADQAEREGRPVAVITTAATGAATGAATEESGGPEDSVRVMPAAEARKVFDSLQPKPWPTNRARALKPLMAPGVFSDARPGDVIWISDGLEETAPHDGGPGQRFADLVEPLQRLGGVTVVSDPAAQMAMILRPPVSDGGALNLTAERASPDGMATVWVRALGDEGRLFAREQITFAAGKTSAGVRLTLPTELLNRLQRLEIEAAATAAGVVLMDERWRRRPVGLVSGAGAMGDQPLLSDLFYLERALKPFAEIRHGRVLDLLERPLAIMVLADPGRLGTEARTRLENWIRAGGVTIRFAGPLLAKATADNGGNNGEAEEETLLLPVRLRRGDRVIGGAMSWSEPAKLSPFEPSSPFYGFTVPKDVTVERQVLAQPSLDLAEKTWARLDDGTPLVTAERRGKGWLVLVHTTASPQWSTLPLSGLFVQMLRRLVAFSQGVAVGVDGGAAGPPLEPLSTLDGFGRLGPAVPHARAIAADVFEAAKVSAAHPPGFYGSKDSRRALNLSAGLPSPKPIGRLPSGVSRAYYGAQAERDFRPWLLVLALVLALFDFAASLSLRGLLSVGRVKAAAVALVFLLPAQGFAANHATDHATDYATDYATDPGAFALANSLETRLAYVITGDRQIDETSRAGLTGLNVILARRTAVELGPPQGVDPARDELAFFPLLYWPVLPDSALATDAAKANVNKYLRNGGTILFDTLGVGGGGADALALHRLARGLDIPPLVPVPPDHVLTRAFYLIKEFPGRWSGGTLWVERAGERVNDGVSPVIAGGNDWAAAWALDDAQRPLYPVVPGGERQREMAFRFGVNLVMYTLTGNYKADQVHMPAILKRLGQ